MKREQKGGERKTLLQPSWTGLALNLHKRVVPPSSARRLSSCVCVYVCERGVLNTSQHQKAQRQQGTETSAAERRSCQSRGEKEVKVKVTRKGCRWRQSMRNAATNTHTRQRGGAQPTRRCSARPCVRSSETCHSSVLHDRMMFLLKTQERG